MEQLKLPFDLAQSSSKKRIRRSNISKRDILMLNDLWQAWNCAICLYGLGPAVRCGCLPCVARAKFEICFEHMVSVLKQDDDGNAKQKETTETTCEKESMA